jgi:hypothetical protein
VATAKTKDHIEFIRKTKYSANVLLWLAVSEYVVSEPIFFIRELLRPAKARSDIDLEFLTQGKKK